MLDNMLTDEKEILGNRNVFPEKDTENTTHWTCDDFREVDANKNIIFRIINSFNFYDMKKKYCVTQTGHIEGEKIRKKSEKISGLPF